MATGRKRQRRIEPVRLLDREALAAQLIHAAAMVARSQELVALSTKLIQECRRDALQWHRLVVGRPK